MSACPKCSVFNSEVSMTRRLRGGWVKRWRKCKDETCAQAWVTVEIPLDTLKVDREAEGMKEVVWKKQ